MVNMTSTNVRRSAKGGAGITTNVAFDTCACLVASADVTATLYFSDGSSVASFPLQKGYNDVQVWKVTFATGTIVALYS